MSWRALHLLNLKRKIVPKKLLKSEHIPIRIWILFLNFYWLCIFCYFKFFENAKATEEIVGKFPKSHKIITDLEKKIAKVKESSKPFVGEKILLKRFLKN